ncbi:MAG TPA: hypothetical protein VE642_12965 [Pyrinomonadaceae bacterium]|nr:hypothetical protein [Pyrinomonadaceae bacterium]
MNIHHPLEAIPEGAATWLAFAALFVLFLILGKLAGPDLDATGITHKRILALERPADAAAARAVIKEWDAAGRLGAVRRSIWWDYAFIPVYTTLTALGCVIVARAFFAEGSAEYEAALLIAWLPWVAGLLDVVENCAMLKMIGGFEGETLPRLARWCATVKFGIVLPLLAWVLVSFFLLALKHLIVRWK